jgi:hypothetical protein
MQLLKQSTAANVPLKVYLSSDHVSAAAGKTLTVTLSKDGAAFGALGGSVTEVSSGWYKVALNTTDANTPGTLVVRATAAACDDAEVVCQVVADLPGATVSSVTGAVGSVTGNVGGNVVGSVASVTAAVTVGTLNAGVITATSVASAALNGKGDWLLSSGYTAPPSAANIATALWQDLTAGSDFTTTGSVGKLLATNLDAAVSSRSTYAGGAVASVSAAGPVGSNNDKSGYSLSVAPPTAAQIATAVLTDTGDNTTAGSPGKVLSQLGGAFTGTTSVYTSAALANAPSGSGASPSAIATAVWQDLTAGADFATSGSVGALVKAHLANVDGKTIPAALQIVAAMVGGKLSGAQTGTEVFVGLDGSTTRATITTDNVGNRTAASYS